MGQLNISHCKGHNAKISELMMDRNQSWFHGTTAGIIYHFKDPLNASFQSDQSPELKIKHFGFADLPPLKADVIKLGSRE